MIGLLAAGRRHLRGNPVTAPVDRLGTGSGRAVPVSVLSDRYQGRLAFLCLGQAESLKPE